MDERRMDPARLEQARSGDPSAFEALVEPRAGAMTRTAMAILGSDADARDAVQDALVLAWRELAALRDPAALDAWLTRILVNRCRRGLRGAGVRRAHEARAHATAVTSSETGKPDASAAPMEERTVEQAFGRLSVDERTLLVLHDFDGCSVAEVAAVLKVSETTANSRLLAARRALDDAREREGALRGVDDDALRAMLSARADRASPNAARDAMVAVRAQIRGGRQGAAFSVLPVLTGRSPVVGAGWAAAAMIAVLVMAIVATRPPGTPPTPVAPTPAAASASDAAASPAAASAPSAVVSVSPPSTPDSTPVPSSLVLQPAHISLSEFDRALADGSLDGRMLLVDSTLVDTAACPAGAACSPQYSLDLVGPVATDQRPGQPVVPARPDEGSTPLAGTFVVVPHGGTLVLVGRMEGSLASPLAPSLVTSAYAPPDPGSSIAVQAVAGWLVRRVPLPCPSVAPPDGQPDCAPDVLTAGVREDGLPAGGSWSVLVDEPALGVAAGARSVAGPFLVRTGTGSVLEVVGRYDIGAYTVVDVPAVTCDLAPGAALPSCGAIAAQALHSVPAGAAATGIEVDQGAYCPPGWACPTVAPDVVHVIVRTGGGGDWLVELRLDAAGRLTGTAATPLPSP